MAEKKKINILLIDDEPLIIVPLFHYLSAQGYSVVATNSSEAAISLISLKEFNIVITDLQMEPINGIKIISYLKNSGFTGRIVLISAISSLKKSQVEALEIDAFFEKPFSIDEVYKKIKEWSADLRPVGTH